MTPEQAFAEMVAQGDIATDKLAECASRWPNKVFVHYGEDGVQLTFAQFADMTDRFAGGLLAAGVKPGDAVSVLTRNSLVSALAMFGIWRAGCLFAPINFNFKGPQLSYQLADTKPSALVTDPSFLEILTEVADACPPRLVIHTPKPGDHDHTGAAFPPAFNNAALLDFGTLCAHETKAPPVSPGPFDLANICYTSGTTGPSKGVLQNFRWINQYTFFLRAFASEDDVIYCDLPLYHVGGAFALLQLPENFSVQRKLCRDPGCFRNERLSWPVCKILIFNNLRIKRPYSLPLAAQIAAALKMGGCFNWHCLLHLRKMEGSHCLERLQADVLFIA